MRKYAVIASPDQKSGRSNLLGDCFVALLLGMTIVCISQETFAGAAYKSPIVRVAVIKNAKHLELTIKSAFKIMPLEIDEVLYSDKFLRKSTVLPTKGGVKIADVDFKVYGISIIPEADSAIHINNRSFRGEVDIIRQQDETLLVVNHINVEDYLRGVLYHEVSHWWPGATLQAQAIAARSFALYQAKVNKGKDYDLESTVFSQVYGGATSEKFRTSKAVYKTLGKVLTYRGKIFPAYYHATCAGHTEDASILWKTDLPPLKGVVCGFCRHSPHFYWKRKLPLKDIENVLSINGIEDIAPKQWDNSGRIVRLFIKTHSEVIDYMAKDFRQKLGGNIIKSAIFKVGMKPNAIIFFEGAGWGHGVGMCQWGAFGMARKGYNAEKILKYYYPGATIETYSQVF